MAEGGHAVTSTLEDVVNHSLRAAVTVAIVLAACAPDSPDTIGPAADEANLSLGSGRTDGFVATMSNATTGNEVLLFPRGLDGRLGAPTSYPTGGAGTGAGLGNQGAIAVDQAGRFLYVVNAGSNSLTVFEITGTGLLHRQTIASGGVEPISIAVQGRLLYALNDGAPAANIAGFSIGPEGTLTPLDGSVRPLSTALPNAAQIGFDGTGRRLVVTEKATNLLVTYQLDAAGRAGEPQPYPSSGPTPFGFGIDARGDLIVSEAFGGAVDASAVSSYRFEGGSLAAVSASVATTETAACWIVISGDGRFAYTTNAGSATISGYRISATGTLTLLATDGVSAATGAGPVDMASVRGRQLIYNLSGGAHEIRGFRVATNGALESIGAPATVPAGVNGLVAF